MAVKKAYFSTTLTGGGEGSLDLIDGALLNNLDASLRVEQFVASIHTLDDDSGVAESSPDIIAPDSNAGTKRWIQAAFNAPTLLTDTVKARSVSGLSLTDDGDNLGIFIEDSTGYIGLGHNSPVCLVHSQGTETSNTDDYVYHHYAEYIIEPSDDTAMSWNTGRRLAITGYAHIPNTSTHNVSYAEGMGGSAENYGSGNVAAIVGLSGWAYNSTNVTVTDIVGINGGTESDAGTIAAQKGILNWNGVYGGTVTNYYGVHTTLENDGGTITNRYGMYIAGTGSATNDYGVYVATASMGSYFAGNVGIGAAANTNLLLDVGGATTATSDDDLGILTAGGQIVLGGVSSGSRKFIATRDSSGALEMITTGNVPVKFWTGGVERFNISGSTGLANFKYDVAVDGKLAIGTTSTSGTKFRVTSDGATTLYEGIFGDAIGSLPYSSGAPYPAPTEVQIGDINGNCGLRFGQAADRNAFIGWIYDSTPADAYFVVATYAGGNPIVIANESQNVGFGAVIDPETQIEMYSAEPYLTLHNSSHEDTDGGRESRINFRGEQSGGEESILSRIEVSHDGSSDDQKGKFIIYTNDGNDADSPSKFFEFDSDNQFGIGLSPTHTLTVYSTGLAGAHIKGAGDSYTFSAFELASDEGTDKLWQICHRKEASWINHLEYTFWDGASWHNFFNITNEGDIGFGGERDPSSLIELTDSEPYITLHNSTEEDSDGGRESRLIFRGEQSGTEESTLAWIEASHDGSSDDQKGKITFYTNDGSDDDAPTLALTIDSSQRIKTGTASPSVATTPYSLFVNGMIEGAYSGTGTLVLGSDTMLVSSAYESIFRKLRDLPTGDAFIFAPKDGSDGELRDTDARQAWMSIEPRIVQSATAAYDAIYVNVDEDSTGDGSTGDGNNLLNLSVNNAVKFLINNSGYVGFGGETAPVTLIEATSTAPYVTLHNSTEEDGDGGRESRIIFKGEQSGGEESTLVILEGSHEGTGDDQAGQVKVYINDGDDDDSPTLAATFKSNGDFEPAGNIVGSLLTKSYTFAARSAASGTHYVGGFYSAPAADSNLDEGSTTQTYGTANHPYAAHAFVVAAAAGSTDGSDLILTVSGTSITDGGTRTTSDSEVIVADCTAASTDEYFETTKKWLGQITYTLTSTAGTTFNFDFNYGLCKYDDIGNRDYQITDFECTGLSAAIDTGFNIELLHHETTGWTYSAAAFVPGSTAILNMNTIHSTEQDLAADEAFAFKRAGLSESISGSGSEGHIVRVTTGANNSIAYMNVHVGFTLE